MKVVNPFAVCLLIGLLQQPVYAEQQPSVSNLQRLFTTQFERAQLDAKRRRGEQVSENNQQSQKAVLPPIEIEVKGVVKRENAPDVVWVNDKSTLKSKNIDDRIRVQTNRISQKNLVPMQVDGKYIKLKPGQVWNEADRTIKDKYQTKQAKKQSEGMEQSTVSDENN